MSMYRLDQYHGPACHTFFILILNSFNITLHAVMDHKGYLRKFCPLALRWAEQNDFEQYQLIDLATIIKLVNENGKDIPTSQVQKQGKIDKGSFGSIFKATYKDQVYVLKCIGQVWFVHTD
jgi:hypothetical protein